MKNLCCIFFLMLTLNCAGQVVADPGTGQMDLTNESGISLNANLIAPGEILTLKVPVYNLNQLVALPAGTCKLIIDLGNNIIPDPSFNLANAALSNYFSWASEVAGAHVRIIGNLITPLPEDFSGIAAFKIKGPLPGTSIITSDFLVTNNNTNLILTDEDPNNNTASLGYTITNEAAPVPVTFTKIVVTKKECTIQISFSAERAINVKMYEIELSKDGIEYIKAGETKPKSNAEYIFDFQLKNTFTAPNIFVRIKSVDNDESYTYSETRHINGNCDEKERKSMLNIYPNPITDHNTDMVIKRDNGAFNGNYKIMLINTWGRIIGMRMFKISNSSQFNYNPGKISAGIYHLQMQTLNGSESSVTKIVKL